MVSEIAGIKCIFVFPATQSYPGCATRRRPENIIPSSVCNGRTLFPITSMFSICVTSPCSQTCARGVILPRTHLTNHWGGNRREIIWEMRGKKLGGTVKQVINVPVINAAGTQIVLQRVMNQVRATVPLLTARPSSSG